MAADAEGVEAEHLREFVLSEELRTSAVSAAVRRGLTRRDGIYALPDETRNTPSRDAGASPPGGTR